MAESKDVVESFLEEWRAQIITGERSPGAVMEAWISLTPQEQLTVLFNAVDETTSQSKESLDPLKQEPELTLKSEQRQQNSRTTQTEQNWTVENTAQSDKQTNKEIIKKHRQLMRQIIDEIEQLLEETQTEKNEMDSLKTQTGQQQEHIERLTSEKHEQHLLIKRLKLQTENVIETLQKSKNAAFQEKAQLLKMQTEIYQEREYLDRRRHDIINERRKLEKIKYDRTGSQASNEPKEPTEQIKQAQDIIERLVADSESVIEKNRNTMFKAKKAQEQIQETIANTEQELKAIKYEISQHRGHVEKIKHTINVKISKLKQRWANTQRDAQMQKAAEMENRRKVTFETVKIKLSRIQEDVEKVWDVMEHCEQQLEATPREKQELQTETSQTDDIRLDSQTQRQDTDVSIETEIWGDGQRQRQDTGSKLAQIQSERAEIEKMKMKIQADRKNVERDRQLAKAEMDAIKCMRESAEKQKQELDNKLQVTKREMREMEVMSREIEVKKKELAKMIRMSKRKTEEISMMKEEIENSKQDMEERHGRSRRQMSEQVLELNMEDRLRRADRTTALMSEGTEDKVSTSMQRVTAEVEDIRKLLHLVREDTEQSRRDQQREKTTEERDELDVMKLNIQQQGEKVEQKLDNTMTTILSVAVMNANIEKAAAVINNTQEEMFRTQRMIGKNKEEVKKCKDKLSFMKAQLHRWILTQSPIKTFALKLQQPQKCLEIVLFI